MKNMIKIVKTVKTVNVKINGSRYKQCGVTPHFWEKNRKDKYWHNKMRKAFW